jgi:hypothetical protein
MNHTRKSRDTAGSGVRMHDALATGLLDGTGGLTQLCLRSRRISTVGCGQDFFHEGFDPRLDRLIAGVPFQVLFMSFLF